MSSFPVRFPRTFGGDTRPQDQEADAIALNLSEAGLNTKEGTIGGALSWSMGGAVGRIWEFNQRTSGAEIPTRMLETLSLYEELTKLRPTPDDTDVARRRAVGGKLRGVAGNAIADISDACSRLLGTQFDGIVTVDPVDEVTYWPGVNPGPPGFEFTSNRCVLGVRISQDGIDDDTFERLYSNLQSQLQDLLPVWEAFAIGVGDDGFTVDEDTVDIDFV